MQCLIESKILLFLLSASVVSLSSCVNETKQTSSPASTPVDTNYLHHFNSVDISLTGNFQSIGDQGQVYPEQSIILGTSNLLWTGLYFHAIYTYSNQWSYPGPYHSTMIENESRNSWSVGTISISGDQIESGESSFTDIDNVTMSGSLYSHFESYKTIKFESISLLSKNEDSLVFSMSGPSIQSDILILTDSTVSFYNGNTRLKRISWDQQPPPVLSIKFHN